MPVDWYTAPDHPIDGGGIYQWWIDGVPRYTGRAINLRSRLAQYERNIARFRTGGDYRRSNPAGWRAIHRILLGAIRDRANIQFRVIETCDSSRLNERERYHQMQMETSAPLLEWQRRRAAEEGIVTAVYDGVRPSDDDERTWRRGGAVFWEQGHWFVAWGLHLPSLDPPATFEEPSTAWRQSILECDDDGARVKFGSIPIRSVDGRSIVAITQFNAFHGDTLRDFYLSEEEFREQAMESGWLLSQDRWMRMALSETDDETLLKIVSSSGDKRHPRHCPRLPPRD